MAFAVSRYDMLCIRDYNDAKALFEKLTPIRGGDQSVRRFVKRSDRTKLLRQEFDNGVEVYAFTIHNTDAVKYYPTHVEIYMGGWNTQSTKNFISGITGIGISLAGYNEFMPAGFRGNRAAQNFEAYANGYPIASNERYQFNFDGTPVAGQMFPEVKKYKVNRARMKALRDQYKPFKEYVYSMAKLVDFTNKEVANSVILESRHAGYNKWRAAVDAALDEATFWQAFTVVAAESYSTVWVYGNGSTRFVQTFKPLDPDHMWANFTRELKTRNLDVLDVEVVKL